MEKILLVDDREDNLLSISTILEPDGYDFIKANSGKEALKILLKEYDFALILMDVTMPILNGFETADLIYQREKLRHIPIIFITANDYGEENIFRGYRTGGVDYIYKPINPELLRAKVGVFVEIYKKNRQLVAQEQKLISINRSLESEIKERTASEQQVKDLNRRLVEIIDRLESANKDLDVFAFMASHDLQEPLRKIQAFSDILQSRYKEILNDDGQKYLKSIQNSAERMQQLINDLLAFSKVSNNENVMTDCNLNEILAEVVKDLENKITERSAKIQADEFPIIPGYSSLLRSLFYNLLENALKYSRRNIETQISIRHVTVSSKTAPRQKFCRILIEDNGIGFEQKYAEHIFSMFRRLHPISEFEGTGIGLAICKKIVEKHNGYISAQSQIDQGSTFTITLPLYKRETINTTTPKESQSGINN
ncbi:MAG: hybrid sensor histidine kinase/response regulator [Bacteroidetes bacterium]|nr:MAG: hybrid sensor histidine kinase/response regulator [Bacteroidota bacterium]